MSASPLPPPSATFETEGNRTSLSDGGRKQRRERSASSDEEEGEVKSKMEEKRGKGERQGGILVNNVYRVGRSFVESWPDWGSKY